MEKYKTEKVKEAFSNIEWIVREYQYDLEGIEYECHIDEISDHLDIIGELIQEYLTLKDRGKI